MQTRKNDKKKEKKKLYQYQMYNCDAIATTDLLALKLPKNVKRIILFYLAENKNHQVA